MDQSLVLIWAESDEFIDISEYSWVAFRFFEIFYMSRVILSTLDISRYSRYFTLPIFFLIVWVQLWVLNSELLTSGSRVSTTFPYPLKIRNNVKGVVDQIGLVRL